MQVNESLVSWLSRIQIHIDPHELRDEPRLVGSEFEGEYLTIVRIEAEGLNRVLARNPDVWFTFGIFEDVCFPISSGKREIVARPQKLCFIALPGELINLRPDNSLVSGYLFHLSVEHLISQAVAHGTQYPSLLTLQDTIPGHEELILACSNQLIKFSALENELSSLRIMQPLEQSIISLLATLVGVDPHVLVPNAGDQSRPSYVQIALTYMEDHISRAITLSDICVACNVSARTLQVAFQSVMRQSPLQVLQELRFKKLRGFLFQGMDVGRACECSGLHLCGRVSGKYKQMFGELPRDTRLRAIKGV